ncbi:MAG: hypothetical protein ACE5I1_26380 [bacterium]
MKSTTRIMAGMIAMTAFALLQNPSFAQEKAGHSHEKAETHGGTVLMSKQHHFEVVWMEDHVMVFLYDGHQKPLSRLGGMNGEVTFKFKDGRTLQEELIPMEVSKMKGMHHDEDDEHGEHRDGDKMAEMREMMGDQDHFMAKVDLSGVKEGEVKATFTLQGLPNKKESTATFTAKYKKMKMFHEHENAHEEKAGHEHNHE